MSQPPDGIGKLVMNDSDESIIYSKGWHTTKHIPNVHSTVQPGATASISFNGSFITVVGTVPSCNDLLVLGLNATTASCSSYRINDGPPVFFNATPNAERLTNQVLFQPTSTLSDDPHTLVIANIDGLLMLDYLTIIPTGPRTSTTSSSNHQRILKIDDTSTNITYTNANAFSDANQADYNSSLHSLSSTRSTASFNFSGNFIAVYGALSGKSFPPNVTFTLDNAVQPHSATNGVLRSTPPLPTTRRRWISQVLFWQSSALNDGPHNLLITPKEGEFLLDFILIQTESKAPPSSSLLPTIQDSCTTACTPLFPNPAIAYAPTLLSPSSTAALSPTVGNTSAIVGGVLGALSFILMLCVIYLSCKKRYCLRSSAPSNSEPSDQTFDPRNSPRDAVVEEMAQGYLVDGSGRPVGLYIPRSSTSSPPPPYQTGRDNGRDPHVDHGGGNERNEEIEMLQDATYGHDKKFAMFGQQEICCSGRPS